MDPEFKPHIQAALELIGSEPGIFTRAWWDNLSLPYLRHAKNIYIGFADYGEDLIRVRTECQSKSRKRARLREIEEEAAAIREELNMPAT